jgi:hypothetical protein
MARRITRTLKEEMMQIVEAWKSSGGRWPAPVGEIVDFAIRNRLYNTPTRLRQLCARDLTEAMREEYVTDSQNRPVRKLHAARITDTDEDGGTIQRTLWADIDTAPRKFMELAFRQRRGQIVGDCRQLSNDVRYYNSKHPDEKPIQMCFDFRDDVAEADQPSEYVQSPES